MGSNARCVKVGTTKLGAGHGIRGGKYRVKLSPGGAEWAIAVSGIADSGCDCQLWISTRDGPLRMGPSGGLD